MSKLSSNANSPEFPRILVDFIGSELTSLKVDKKLRIQAMLQSEEIMVKFKEHSTTDNITVTVKKSFGDPFIEIRMGHVYKFTQSLCCSHSFFLHCDLHITIYQSERTWQNRHKSNRHVYAHHSVRDSDRLWCLLPH